MPLFRRRQILPNKLWCSAEFYKNQRKAKVHLFACLSASMIDEFTDEKKKEREPKDAFIKKEMVVLSRNSESSYTCPSELVSRLFREFLTCF